VHLQGPEIVEALAQRHVGDLEDRARLPAFAHLHVPRLVAQPGAPAFGAGLHAAIARQFLAYRDRIGLAVAPLHVGDDAFERMFLAHLATGAVAGLHGVAEPDFLLARAVQDGVAHRLGQVLEWRIDVEAVVLAQAFDQREVIAVAPVPALHGAAGQREGRESHHPRRVEELHMAEPVAGRAGPDRRVEGEQARLELADGVVADRAGELGIEPMLVRPGGVRLAVHLDGDGPAIGQPQRGLEALGQPLLHVGPNPKPVDHHVDVVLLGLLELGQPVEFIRFPVDPKTHIAARLHLGEEVDELALAVARHRGQHHEPRFRRQRQHRVDHLRDRLRLQRQVVERAIRRAGAGKQQAQVVVDLGDRADRGARVVRRGLLLDRNRRRQALDHVDVGLVHQLQELPRIGRQAFDVAALAFGVQRVERQRRLARTRQPGDHHQLVAWNVQVDVLEVMGAGAADADPLGQRCGEISAAVVRMIGRAVGERSQGRLRQQNPT